LLKLLSQFSEISPEPWQELCKVEDDTGGKDISRKMETPITK
jgi:hypothetical protein